MHSQELTVELILYLSKNNQFFSKHLQSESNYEVEVIVDHTGR